MSQPAERAVQASLAGWWLGWKWMHNLCARGPTRSAQSWARPVLRPPDLPADWAGCSVTSTTWLWSCFARYNWITRHFTELPVMYQLLWPCLLHVLNKLGQSEILLQMTFDNCRPISLFYAIQIVYIGFHQPRNWPCLGKDTRQ